MVAQTYVSNLEAGRCNPTAVSLYLIAKALRVQVADLFDEREVPGKLLTGLSSLKQKIWKADNLN